MEGETALWGRKHSGLVHSGRYTYICIHIIYTHIYLYIYLSIYISIYIYRYIVLTQPLVHRTYQMIPKHAPMTQSSLFGAARPTKKKDDAMSQEEDMRSHPRSDVDDVCVCVWGGGGERRLNPRRKTTDLLRSASGPG